MNSDATVNKSAAKASRFAVLLGSAFLMATSSIGPGFLNNVSLLTSQYRGCFLVVLLIVLVMDIVVQLNVWQITCVAGRSATDLGNSLFRGWGFALTVLLAISSLAFNVGNIGGGALGLYTICGLNQTVGAIVTCILAIILFWAKDLGKAMDQATKILGSIMILGVLIVLCFSFPSPARMAQEIAKDTNLLYLAAPIITIIGSAAGGYVPLSGSQRLIDAGITGKKHLREIRQGSLMGIGIGEGMRFLLFLAVLGVLYKGASIDPANPAASAFRSALGEVGYRIFGVIIFFASATSLVGCSYTLAALLRPFHPIFEKRFKELVTVIAVISTLVMVTVGQPAAVLLIAGVISGLIMPFILATLLIVSLKEGTFNDGYRHPRLLIVLGFAVVLFVGYYGIRAIPTLGTLF